LKKIKQNKEKALSTPAMAHARAYRESSSNPSFKLFLIRSSLRLPAIFGRPLIATSPGLITLLRDRISVQTRISRPGDVGGVLQGLVLEVTFCKNMSIKLHGMDQDLASVSVRVLKYVSIY
jgi:hypothetical protein